MPPRKRKVWRPLRQLRDEKDPLFYASLLGNQRVKLIARAQGKIVRDAIKGGDTKVEGDFLVIKGPTLKKLEDFQAQITRQKQASYTFERNRPFSHEEKKEVHLLLHSLIRRIDGADPSTRAFLKRKLDLDGGIQSIDSLKYLFSVARDFKHFLESPRFKFLPAIEQERWAHSIPKILGAIFRTAGTQLVYRHLLAHGFPATYAKIDKIFETNFPNIDFEAAIKSNRLNEIEQVIVREIVHDRKQSRIARAIETQKMGRKMKRVKRVLQGFDMPRGDLKERYREARIRLKSGEPGPIRPVAHRAFKKSRFLLRTRLQEMGLDADAIFEALDLNGKLDQVTVARMRKLKELNEIFRTHHSLEERKTRIAALTERETRLPNTTILKTMKPAPFSLPAQPLRNPAKAAARVERKERSKPPLSVPRPAPAPPRPALTSMHSILSYFETQKQIRPEDVIDLRKFLRNLRPKEHGKKSLVRAIRFSLLCEMATHHKKSGRVQERALREEAVPQTLHFLYKEALSTLLREGVLRYTSHYGHSDFITLSEAAAGRILGKFDTKRAHQSPKPGE